MTQPATLKITDLDIDVIASAEGRVAVIVPADGKMSTGARRVNRLMKGALARFVESEAFEKLGMGKAKELAFPVGMQAEAVLVVKLDRSADALTARKAGASIGRNSVGKAQPSADTFRQAANVPCQFGGAGCHWWGGIWQDKTICIIFY